MRCTKSELWMLEAVDGTLPTPDREQLMVHLDGCAECRAIWQTLTAVEKMLVSPPSRSPAPGFAQRVEARLDRFEAQRRTLVGGLILLGAATALCLLAVPSLLNGRNPLEAYGLFLQRTYAILGYGLVLGYKLVAALWLTLDVLARSVDIPLMNLLTYIGAAVLAGIAGRRALAAQRLAVQSRLNGRWE